MAAEESPEPRDIYWFNTRVTQKERKRRRILVESFLFLLYVFYVVPVTLLYLLLSSDSITSYARWIKHLYETVKLTISGLCLVDVELSVFVFFCVLVLGGFFPAVLSNFVSFLFRKTLTLTFVSSRRGAESAQIFRY